MKIRSVADSGQPELAGTRLSRLPAWFAPVVLVVVAFGWTGTAWAPSPPAPAPAASPRPPSTPAATPSSTAASPALPRSAPTRLLIPTIDVDAPFTELAIGPSGRLNAPPADDTNLAGWFAAGPSPGERGTAIVAGHLDTTTKPAVFARLSTLDPGDEIAIKREDGTTATFLVDNVDNVDNFPRDDFPDDRVYADTLDPQLRLITCGGSYDHSNKQYTENTVVFAHLKTPAPRNE
ncbi:class F sortase [Streptomyces luteolus]|uniref:Class F sortase n=1 Tax=Streptomyces luteolus TaxID=3043615 RepID=A0ABT6T8H2_9ACTN|nr:class F sortase [Streptomyces sp. B-S-A12]MDI3424174.1 class F sortase [Streptomyces sp. B-S-A12]